MLCWRGCQSPRCCRCCCPLSNGFIAYPFSFSLCFGSIASALLNSTTSPPPAVVIWKHSLGLPIGLSPQLASHIRRQKFSIPRWGPSSWLPGSDIVIAAEKIGGIEFGFKHVQSGVIDTIDFTSSVSLAVTRQLGVV